MDAFAADMSSQAEVRRLAREVLGSYPRLDVLVNNVGGFWATRQVTADGLEHTFAVNYLAGFLLTDLLLDRLKASAPARIGDGVLRCAQHRQAELRRPAGCPGPRPLFKTPAQGALTSVYLASSPEVEDVTGQYFVNRKPAKSSKSSYDTAAASRLWQLSADLVARTAGP